MTSNAVLYQAVWRPVTFHLLYTLIQSSSYPHVREVQAAVNGYITIICNYDTSQYRNMVSSWCRQISNKECNDIVTTNSFKNNVSKVRISQTIERHGFVNVTMDKLQQWDTGLYQWRVWTGRDYKIIEKVLLHVVYGLPSNLLVANYKTNSTAEMPCEYNERQKWSKTWVKRIDDNEYDWLVHSDGNRNVDYNSRALVFIDSQKRVLIMRLTQLELWDSGLYQCRESGGQNIVREVLLLVTLNNDREYINPAQSNPRVRDLESSYATVKPRSEQGHNRAWEIVRWLLFLSMALSVLLFTYYNRLSGICLIRNCLLRPQMHEI